MLMRSDLLKVACTQLGWRFEVKIESSETVLYVYDAKQNVHLHGEYALKVANNIVTYNRYFLKNGLELAKILENQFYELNIAYSVQTVVHEFEAMGFKYMPDLSFVANEIEKKRFKMVAHSKIAAETEKRTEITFTVLHDGTVVSDSNYIPEDVHHLADKAMAAIDATFGTSRKEGTHIRRKAIPAKYKTKTYCKPDQKIISKR
ncbi:MAG: hypothetical protein RLZZ628_831 [Bacteroidota bacterium]